MLTFSALYHDLSLFREIAYRRTYNIVFSRMHRQYIMSVFSDGCTIFGSGDVYTRPGKRLAFPILYITYNFCRLMPLREPWQVEHDAKAAYSPIKKHTLFLHECIKLQLASPVIGI